MIADGGIYRRVVTSFGLENYQAYMTSGLHRRLVSGKLVLDHQDEPAVSRETGWARLLTPEQIPFISYPFEWSFSELRDAALLTLEIEDNALAFGMSLKDASPFNVQFRGSRPVFIDTLSFENDPGGPWIAYEQFCRQFLAPLLLMSYGWPDANRYLKIDLNGFHLRQASRLLPWRSFARLGVVLHLHLHARSANGRRSAQAMGVERGSKAALVASLRRTIEKLKAPAGRSRWSGYYHDSPYYSRIAHEAKEREVRRIAGEIRPSVVYDLGANTGLFARAVASAGAYTVAFERDEICVDRLYREERTRGVSRILPLVMDLENPSPSLGFGLTTTLSLAERPPADLVLCLALVHHLRFSANLPLSKQADFFQSLGRFLLIEFVPADDPAAAMLRQGRAGFDDYTTGGFLAIFNEVFILRREAAIEDSRRCLYLFERRG